MECSICLKALEKFSRKLSCSHEFHCYCVDQWLGQHRSCPICRSQELTLNQWMGQIFEAANFTLPKKNDNDVLKLLDYGLAAHFDVTKYSNNFCIMHLFIAKHYSEAVIFKAIDCGFPFQRNLLCDANDPQRKPYYDNLTERAKNVNKKSTQNNVNKETVHAFILAHINDKSPETLEEFDNLVSMTVTHINISNVLLTAVKADRLDFVKIMLRHFPLVAWLGPISLTQRTDQLIHNAKSQEMKNFLISARST